MEMILLGLGKDFVFHSVMGLGQNRSENPLLCHPLIQTSGGK